MNIVKATNDGTKYLTKINAAKNQIIADELASSGGAEAGFTPTELLCSSLAACTVITLRMYTDHKNWDAGIIEVNVSYINTKDENPGYFERELGFSGNLSEQEKERIKLVAEKCPIHKILAAGHSIHTIIK